MCLRKINLISGLLCVCLRSHIYWSILHMSCWYILRAGSSVQRFERFCTSPWNCSASRWPAACMFSFSLTLRCIHLLFLLSLILIRCDKCASTFWFIPWLSWPWLPRDSPCGEGFTDRASIKPRHSTAFSWHLEYYCSTPGLCVELFCGHVTLWWNVPLFQVALEQSFFRFDLLPFSLPFSLKHMPGWQGLCWCSGEYGTGPVQMRTPHNKDPDFPRQLGLC